MPPFYTTIETDAITASIQIRKVTPEGVRLLKQSIQERGYLERFPLAVVRIDGTGEYKLLDGNHRLEAVRQLDLKTVPAQVFDELAPDEEYRLAYESNRGQDAIVRQYWTDDAEFIWSLAAQAKTQQQIADILRWSREAVKNYATLQSIAFEAWQIIVGTTKEGVVPSTGNEPVPSVGTFVPKPFTEGLLRSITSLTADQQLELVKDLAAGRTTKEKFRNKAERYKARNTLKAEAERRLRDLPPEYLAEALEELDKGLYDKEGIDGHGFARLIQQLLDKYEDSEGYRLYVADVSDMAELLGPDSVDVIITDPPYGRDALPLYEKLARMAAVVLRPGGSLIVMTGQSYLPEIMAAMGQHMRYHWTGAYLTPGGQAVKLYDREVNTFWKPLLWYVKGKHTDRWVGDVVKSEVNDNDKRFHHWGQSESGMADVIEKFSKKGYWILDPFAGGGTTGVAAKARGRKFIGSDISAECIEKTRERIEEVRNERRVRVDE